MTFLEKFKEDHPNAPLHEAPDSRLIPYSTCPWRLGYEKRRKCTGDCSSCWNREFPRLKTIADHFFELFPNAPKNSDGTPKVCVADLGLVDGVFDAKECKSYYKCSAEECRRCFEKKWVDNA